MIWDKFIYWWSPNMQIQNLLKAVRIWRRGDYRWSSEEACEHNGTSCGRSACHLKAALQVLLASMPVTDSLANWEHLTSHNCLFASKSSEYSCPNGKAKSYKYWESTSKLPEDPLLADTRRGLITSSTI